MIFLGVVLGVAIGLFLFAGSHTRHRPRDLTPEELAVAREADALTPGTPAYLQLAAPQWMREEGERQIRDAQRDARRTRRAP